MDWLLPDKQVTAEEESSHSHAGQHRGGAGYTRDLILMLIDVHAVLDHLYLDGTQPQITSPAEDYLRESASPYSLPTLIDALSEVTDQLSRAERQALDNIPPSPPACEPASTNPAASF